MNANRLIFGTGVSSCKDFDGLLAAVRAAAANGIRRFDTAPSYRTEKTLGDVFARLFEDGTLPREEARIQTKLDAWQMREGNVRKHAEDAMKKLRVDRLDALLVHWPLPEYMDATWTDMLHLREEGLVGRVGVCNVRMRQLTRMAVWDAPPEIVQIERHPLRTCAEEAAFCTAHGMELQAYSPLCKMDARIRDSASLQTIAEKHRKSVGQIALRWHLDSGDIPVFTSTKPGRIAEYADIFDFRLTEAELSAVSSLNENYKMYLESWACPGF